MGFMGAGKTTLGERVARELDLPFFDLDARIERASGATVSDIFAREGEARFREIEARELRGLLSEAQAGVVALGGGAFTIETNRDLLEGAGTTVWLDVPLDDLLRRVDGVARPLWKSPAEARELHSKRVSSYALADHRLELKGLTLGEACERLRALLIDIGGEP